VSVTLRPEDGFGKKHRSPGPQPVPRATFPEDAPIRPGLRFTAETPDGAPVVLYVTRVDDAAVFVDTNHPFAGLTLKYDVEVVSVRAATREEKKAGVPRSKAR
jgi:FKBP-type peptidyl-prolyl cis-trans isomerase SlyD